MIAPVLAAAVALAAPRPADPPVVLGLVVTSNRSLELGRPDLTYADDDGARWAELLGTFAAPDGVELLTTFDADSARLFPALVETTPAPTRAHLDAAVARLTARASSARRDGRAVELYVVYAGHGDVDRGRGFVSLADGPFTADDLRALLAAIPATHAHVLLDSCNSFFLVQPRKPGGRRFATPRDAALGLERALPHVGVFLSTSAEAEVYEWSELQSGIFSHAVRSGLAGGADANRDGRVTYDELDAFVGIATAGLKNPSFRPRVFARGPEGRGGATLLDLRAAHGVTLALDPSLGGRVTVRDGAGVPVADVHQAADAPVSLRLPSRWTNEGVVETRAASGGARDRRGLGDPLDGATLALGQLAAAGDAHAVRGADELVGALFARPFGAAAMTTWLAARDAAPAPVYGIGHDDVARMRVILDHVGAEQRAGRMRGALGLFGVGGLTLGAASLIFDPPDAAPKESLRPMGWTLVGVGVGAMIAGGVALVLRSDGEKLRERFDVDLASTPDPAMVVARTEGRLGDLAEDYRRTRKVMLVAGGTILAAGALGLTANELGDAREKRQQRLYLGSMALMGAFMTVFALHPYPIETFIDQWREDPGLQRLPRYVLAPGPVGDDGLGVGLAGTFD